jgi:hypothetical protein
LHCGREALDMPHVLVWDIETVPDGYAAANVDDGKSDDEI